VACRRAASIRAVRTAVDTAGPPKNLDVFWVRADHNITTTYWQAGSNQAENIQVPEREKRFIPVIARERFADHVNAKFCPCPPTIAGKRVIQATFSNFLRIYGPLDQG